ncbi:MAG: polar amino acid transport system substrate-binding protein [Colwellia sp.]|jgi:polar amino acid transport system substrate-binding protein
MPYKYILFIVFSWSLQVGANDTINIASDEWCPYICNEDDKPGILIEIINEIAEAQGYDVNFTLMPLARSLRLLQQSKLDMVLALTKEHIEAFDLRQSQQVYGGLYNDFYVSNETQWKFSTIENLKNFIEQGNILGLINGYEYGSALSRLKETSGEFIFLASGDKPLSSALKMLSKQRITVLLDSRFNVEYEIQDKKITNLQYAGTQGIFVPLFIGFAPDTTLNYISTFDKGLIKLRKKGQLSKILQRYGISDWHSKK